MEKNTWKVRNYVSPGKWDPCYSESVSEIIIFLCVICHCLVFISIILFSQNVKIKSLDFGNNC